ncbi:MAG: formamidopyrimidine-DNA glycosylase [Candidatus Micrarchaeota archaeon]|nr:MAG: formamidopyrimidine-DNA glycosylase [Candidatus Micrarchaeota archaeon]
MEGPGVKVIAERLSMLKGSIIEEAGGNTKKIDIDKLRGRYISSVSSYGKNLLVKVDGLGYLRIHFLMYGSYSIDNRTKPDKALRLYIKTDKASVYFYNCSVSLLSKIKRYGQDVLSKRYSYKKALESIKDKDAYICDLLLDQRLFPGIGNIIKVEALYRAKVHPLSVAKNIPDKKLMELIKEAVSFSKLFYETRKKGERLKEYLQCYSKRLCISCNNRLIRKRTGKTNRFTYYCESCQRLY